MAKNFKKGLSAILAALMCASTMSTAAFAEGETVKEVVSGTQVLSTGKVTLKKVDENGNSLSGAEFKLYTEIDGEEIVVGTYSLDDGELFIGNLAPGSYWLEETKAPEGYVLPEKAIEIEVTKDGVIELNGEAVELIKGETVEGEHVRETLEGSAPEVTIELIPGETAEKYVETDPEFIEATEAYEKYSSAVRKVEATTSEVEVTNTVTSSNMKSVQPALKFDRNSEKDQKAQKVARELYTDNGHFADPSSITVADAPDGYPYKYVGFGDYSGHYVSHIRVIYERDEAGNALKDENGNYIIKELQHGSSGAVLHYNGETTTNVQGPFHYATGTRAQQFLLMNKEGDPVYGYCIDVETGAESGTWYAIANLEDNDYYASGEAENHIRNIVMNGYWGTAEGETGSLSVLKKTLKAAVANGDVDDEYDVTLVNRKKYTTGYELQEGEYHHGSYVYWNNVPENEDDPVVQVVLTDDVIDGLTEGEAIDAMQMAIWSYANGANCALDGEDGMIVGDPYVGSSAMSDSLNGKNDYAGAARTKALYEYLINLDDEQESTVVINDKTFAKDMTLTVGEGSDGVYAAELNFTLDAELSEKDDLAVVLTYVDADGVEQTIENSMSDLSADENGYYTLSGLSLKAGVPFEFALNIAGEQYLEKAAYILTSEKGTNGSQTFVTLAEGTTSVNVTKSAEIVFSVDDYAEARYDRYSYIVVVENTPETPTISFESGKASNISFMLIDPATGEVEFLEKIDIGGETSFEIPFEEGKISAVFVKQSTSGMFWFSEEVDEDVQDAVIACLKEKNPSYKGYNAIAFGEGDHELEFKKGKFATYTFTGSTAVLDSDSVVELEVSTDDTNEVNTNEGDDKIITETVIKTDVEVYGAKVAKKTVLEDGTIAVYIKADGKIPAVIWTSEEVDDRGAVIEALDVEGDAEYVYGFGKQNIEYQHNKNKTKTVTYTFESIG